MKGRDRGANAGPEIRRAAGPGTGTPAQRSLGVGRVRPGRAITVALAESADRGEG
jgi:hypothetical protein